MKRLANVKMQSMFFMLITVFPVTLLISGCATLTKPTWPWSDIDSGQEENPDDESSSVISSEFAPSNEDFGWNALKGDTIKRRFKKIVGRGPNESVAKDAQAFY